MITELTQDQIDQIPHYAEKWFKIITSTNRPDKPKAEEAVREICEVLKLEKPEITWCDGLKMYDKIVCIDPASLNLNLYDGIFDKIFVDGFHKKIRRDVYIQLDRCISESSEKVFNVVDDIDGTFINRGYFHFFSYTHSVYNTLFYDYFTNCLGIEDTAGLLKPFTQVLESCFSVSLLKGSCVLCEQPLVLLLNDQGSLHNDKGPALAFKDGFEVYAFNGIDVPKEWITDPEKLTAHEAISIENIELRRCAMQIVGMDKVIDQLNPREIDRDPEPETGTLIEVELPDLDEGARFVHVRCGTGRYFYVGVPNSVNTALEAQAWMRGVPAYEFKMPEVRT